MKIKKDSLQLVEGNQKVYCMEVDGTNNFVVRKGNKDIVVKNCAGWNLRKLLEEGLNGVSNKTDSSPAKHLSSAMLQIVNFLGIMQNEWAGAQAFSGFDTALAPFIKKDNMTDSEIKQCIQYFVWGLNIPGRWGCVDLLTEVLTVDGFKAYKELKEGDSIFTWKNGKLNTCKVNKVVVKEFHGKMHTWSKGDYSQRVTSNHRMLAKLKGDETFQIYKSEDLVGENPTLPVTFGDLASDKEFKALLSKFGGEIVEGKTITDLDYMEEDYFGVVWCPSVDDGTAIFRKDDKVFISGQSQAPFSNITLDLEPPQDMREQHPYIAGEKQEFLYGDLQEEMDRFNSVFFDVLNEGDSGGNLFQYPIITLNITPDFKWEGGIADKIFDTTSKWGSFYFSNYINSDMNPSDVRSMCVVGDTEIYIED